jgi:DNA-binding FadR family transcriptional regulator
MPKRSEENSSWSPDVGPGIPPRTRAADFAFEKLAGAILRGEMKPGSSLPGERELAEKLGISRVIIREAIHRLKELELVRVRQGGQTIILDPADSPNPRLIPLVIELSSPEKLAIREMAERQLFQALTLLEIAEGRLGPQECDELYGILDRHRDEGDDARNQFIREFWTAVARGTKNQFLWRETAFWFDVAARRGFGGSPYFDYAKRMQIHRELVDRLRSRGGAASHFRIVMKDAFDALAAAASG